MKKIKAWAVVDKEGNEPTLTFNFQKGQVGEHIRIFETVPTKEEAEKRKSWINKPDQKYYKVIPCTITYSVKKK